MSTITIELMGGPWDGTTIRVEDHETTPDPLPLAIAPKLPAYPGRYTRTRKLSRVTGRLIYQWSTLR